MEVSGPSSDTQSKYVVKDAGGSAFVLLCALAFFAISVTAFLVKLEVQPISSLVIKFLAKPGQTIAAARSEILGWSSKVAFFCLILSYLIFKKYSCLEKGFVVDLKKGTLTFPGGMTANSALDYFNPVWYIQKFGFKRGKVKLEDIVSIRRDFLPIRIGDHTSYQGVLYVNGAFGSIKYTFASEAKRDQLYAILGSTLKLGEPVVVRDL